MDIRYYLNLSDKGYYIIESIYKETFSAGYDKGKVVNLIERLNECHRPSIEQTLENEIYVCWGDHERSEKCEFIKEI